MVWARGACAQEVRQAMQGKVFTGMKVGLECRVQPGLLPVRTNMLASLTHILSITG